MKIKDEALLDKITALGRHFTISQTPSPKGYAISLSDTKNKGELVARIYGPNLEETYRRAVGMLPQEEKSEVEKDVLSQLNEERGKRLGLEQQLHDLKFPKEETPTRGRRSANVVNRREHKDLKS